jgi:regulator of sigma E protease
MGVFIQIAQFLFSLSILILLHEAGHFFTAKLFKIRVEKFYLFFDPWFSLFKFKRGETEYGIGWLPLGGYVKISGMIDESMDKEQMKLPPEPWEFRAKPGWQRLIVMVAGVSVNLILGFLIYCALIYTQGTQETPISNLKYGIYCDSLASNAGLRRTDTIIGVGNIKINTLDSIVPSILLDGAKSIEVRRNGNIISIPISKTTLSDMLGDPKGFIDAGFPCVVDSVMPGMGAAKAGLRKNDSIVALDTIPIHIYQDLAPLLMKRKNKMVNLTMYRYKQLKMVTASINNDGKLGFYPKGPSNYIKTVKKQYSFFQSIPAGFNRAVKTVVVNVKSFVMLFTVKGAHKHLGGFISIGKNYAPVWDWSSLWQLTAFLSIMLAFINILPIPALDGGHVMFLVYEMITGRKPNEKVLEYAQYAGMILLLSLMLYANGMDIIRNFFHQ